MVNVNSLCMEVVMETAITSTHKMNVNANVATEVGVF